MSNIGLYGGINLYVEDINTELCCSLLIQYGKRIEEHELQEEEFSGYGPFVYFEKEARYQRRILPDHPRHEEVLSKLIALKTRRKELTGKHKIWADFSCITHEGIFPGFDDWRAALKFANYSHMWSKKSNKEKINPEYIATINAERYKRFGLTSLEAVQQVKPGALFQVEHVFGEEAAGYVHGDLERFMELLQYAQKNSEKSKVYFLSCV